MIRATSDEGTAMERVEGEETERWKGELEKGRSR